MKTPHYRLIIFSVCALFVSTLTSCSPSISSKLTNDLGRLPAEQKVVVYGVDEITPLGADTIGSLKIGSTGFTNNCSYDTVIALAKSEAHWMGGNTVKIYEHRLPNKKSKCHKIKANVLRLPIDSIKAKLASQKKLDNNEHQDSLIHTKKSSTPIKPFRISVQSGLSFIKSPLEHPMEDNYEDYTKELKSGYHFSADFSYYFLEVLGVGAKYSQFYSSHSESDVNAELPALGLDIDNFSDDIAIMYIGPSFSVRLFDQKKKNCLILTASAGYMHYKNEALRIGDLDLREIKGSTLGFSYDLTYDIKLISNLYLGLQATWHTGSLSEYDLTQNNETETIELNFTNYQSLSRLDVAAGLRLVF